MQGGCHKLEPDEEMLQIHGKKINVHLTLLRDS